MSGKVVANWLVGIVLAVSMVGLGFTVWLMIQRDWNAKKLPESPKSSSTRPDTSTAITGQTEEVSPSLFAGLGPRTGRIYQYPAKTDLTPFLVMETREWELYRVPVPFPSATTCYVLYTKQGYSTGALQCINLYGRSQSPTWTGE